jgi:hypothetical protein
MIQDLENSKNGLNNLKDTYFDDLMFCCKIDTIIQDIDARLEEIKSNYSFIKQKSNPINIPSKNISNIHASPQMESSTSHDSLPSSLSSVESISGNLSQSLSNSKNKNKH